MSSSHLLDCGGDKMDLYIFWRFWFQLIVHVLELKPIAHLLSWYLIAMMILMVCCENYRYLILLMAKMIRKMDSFWWCWLLMYNSHVVKFANGPPAHMFSLSQDSYPGHKSSPAMVYKVFKICKIGNQNRCHLKHRAHNIGFICQWWYFSLCKILRSENIGL